MDRTRAAALLPWIKAFAEGHPLQWKHKSGSGWTDLNQSFSTAACYEYRYKPKESKLYMFTYQHSNGGVTLGGQWASLPQYCNAPNSATGLICLTFQEGNLIRSEKIWNKGQEYPKS